MQPYQNAAGDSGVTAYETGRDFIKVRFKDGKTYLYTHASTGKSRIDRMKALAHCGSGLSTYISRYVRQDYEKVLGE